MSLKETTSAVDINDYLLTENPTKIRKSHRYEVLLQNETDFIISHKKAKCETELVILISEGLFYLKDKKTENIEGLSIGKIKSFLRALGDASITLDQVKWLPSLSKKEAANIEIVIFNSTYVEMYKNKMFVDLFALTWCAGLWKKNQELFAKLHSYLSVSKPHFYQPGMKTAFEVSDRFGIDEAVFFVELLAKSGIKSYSSSLHKWDGSMNGFLGMFDKEKSFNTDFRRLVEYTFVDAPLQGIAHIDGDFWTMYQNYLMTQLKVYGEIKDMYPRYLKTAYDVMALNAGLISDDTAFAERADDVAELAHKGKVYSIIVPDTLRQVAEEGITLNHCVGTSAESSDSHIIFMRESHAPEQPLITLLFNKGQINQAVGQHRRGLNDDERKFLEDWGSENGIVIAA